MLTLSQAVELAAEKYRKRPARATLKTAAQEGRLKARKVKTPQNLTGWMVEESDLAEYLEDWIPGQAAPPGNKRRVGKKHSEETKARIRQTTRATKNNNKSSEV